MFDRAPENTRGALGAHSRGALAHTRQVDRAPAPPSRGGAAQSTGTANKHNDQKEVPPRPRKWTPPAPRKYFPVADGWHLKASCRGIDVELFYPDQPGLRTPGSRNPANHTVDVIHSMCRSCPVRVDCLNSALNEREEHAIRAGVEFNQRHHRQWAYRVAVAHSKQPNLARLTHHLDNPPKGKPRAL
jgi:hypothetical protein